MSVPTLTMFFKTMLDLDDKQKEILRDIVNGLTKLEVFTLFETMFEVFIDEFYKAAKEDNKQEILSEYGSLATNKIAREALVILETNAVGEKIDIDDFRMEILDQKIEVIKGLIKSGMFSISEIACGLLGELIKTGVPSNLIVIYMGSMSNLLEKNYKKP